MSENHHTPHIGSDDLNNLSLNERYSDLDSSITDNISVLTTKGDLKTYSTVNARLAVGINGYVLTADSSQASGLKWQPGPSYFAIFRDEKSSGTPGGGTTGGIYVPRDLNTELSDTRSIVSIGSNIFTPVAGTYLLEARAPAFDCNLHRLKLYNASTLSDVEFGQYTSTATTSNTTSWAQIICTFTASGLQGYSIRHYTETTKATTGFGNAVSDGAVEVYCEVKITLISI